MYWSNIGFVVFLIVLQIAYVIPIKFSKKKTRFLKKLEKMECLGFEGPYPGKATYQKQIYSSSQPENKHKHKQKKKFKITNVTE